MHVADRAKAQPLSARILTPTGWNTVGQVRAGDQVLTPSDGIATVEKVVGDLVHPVFKVTCSDGTSTEASDDHVWQVDFTTPGNHGLRDQLVTTVQIQELIATGKRWKRAYLPPVTVNFEAREHLLSPYLIGSLIGDGSLPERSSPVLCGAEADRAEQMDYLLHELPDWAEIVEYDSKSTAFTVRLLDSEWTPGWMHRSRLKTELRRIGLLDCRDRFKFIPDEYLFDSHENRLALLKGLMDTDGNARRDSGSGVYATVSSRLAQQVQELVVGLGGDTSLSSRLSARSGVPTGQTAYKVSVRNLDDVPFRLQRKANLWLPSSRRSRPRRIVSVEYQRDEPVVSIVTDDSRRGGYVTDGMIPA